MPCVSDYRATKDFAFLFISHYRKKKKINIIAQQEEKKPKKNFFFYFFAWQKVFVKMCYYFELKSQKEIKSVMHFEA